MDDNTEKNTLDENNPNKNDFELFGCMEGTVTFQGDIISPIEAEWEACE